jgi:hypothetical protein
MDAEAKRAALIEYLSHGVGGDKEAAEWILLAILARMCATSNTPSSDADPEL